NNKREAVAKLREAQRLAADRPEIVKLLQGKINSIEAQLDFGSSFEQGIRYYAEKNYAAAMKAFERALSLQPDNSEVRRWYEDARARALAKDEPLTNDVRAKYLQGLEYFTSGDYEKALQIWEECRKLQPYNKRILDAIDQARELLRKR
ncbi:MAG: tetratricopeptide repeat protein, partial [candidate division KSB1 bacterium]|nr:tetratricopeptide repeat protein [candidate division KSB1 bacterium]